MLTKPRIVYRQNDSNDTLRNRFANTISGGYDHADTMHNIYLDFGYPQRVEFNNLWNMYRRFGIARNGCDLPVETGWMTTPDIVGSDQFNNEWSVLVEKLKLWQRLQGLDKRQRVGRYAGLFMRVKDSKDPSTELDRVDGIGGIVEIIPLYEGQLTVLNTDDDIRSDTYGQPTLYQYVGAGTGNRNERQASTFNIHPSRIIIAAEDADDGTIYGVPAMESPYNSLMDLRKIIGAGGEGFYKNAAQNIVFNVEDAANGNVDSALLNDFNDKYDEFAQNRFRRAIWTPGMKAETLDSMLASNPKEYFMSALNDAAAGFKIPATILIGQQTGRLASAEDSRSFLASVNSRRNNYMTELVSNVVDWLMSHGVITISTYDITWDDLLALSDDERLANADKMAKINKEQFSSGGDVPFSGEEIREQAGYEAEEIPDELNGETPEFVDDGEKDEE